MWSLSTNQRPASRPCDHTKPIKGHYIVSPKHYKITTKQILIYLCYFSFERQTNSCFFFARSSSSSLEDSSSQYLVQYNLQPLLFTDETIESTGVTGYRSTHFGPVGHYACKYVGYYDTFTRLRGIHHRKNNSEIFIDLINMIWNNTLQYITNIASQLLLIISQKGFIPSRYNFRQIEYLWRFLLTDKFVV